MPIGNILKSAAGTCPFCQKKAGVLSREHTQSRRILQAGWQEMVTLAEDAARTHQFDENSLQLYLGGQPASHTGTGTP